MADGCFHCGEPLPRDGTRYVTVQGVAQPVCCPGCEAAVLMILGAGLENYYRFRTAVAVRPEPARDEWDAFDRTEAQRDWIAHNVDGTCEATLAVEGIRCAACTWLIERALGDLPGVTEVRVNPATGRVHLRWQATQVRIGELLRRLARLGYRPHPLGTAEAEESWLLERRRALKGLAVAGLGMMQVMMNAVAVYLGEWQQMSSDFRHLLNVVSLLLTLPVVLYSAQPFFAGAWRSLRARRPGMDVPVALGIAIAFAASVWNTFTRDGEVYFDSVTMFVFFLLLGRYVELQARHHAGSLAEALARALPTTVLRERNGAVQTVARHELERGDVVHVRVGEAVPADGEIVSGETRIDESLLTGESVARVRGVGDVLIAGSINLSRPVRLRVVHTGSETRLSHIARLLLRAQAERPALAQLADRIAGVFVIAVLLAAAATFMLWWLAEPRQALATAVAVLVVSCPCALSLATPVALTAASNRLARQGLLLTRGGKLDSLARVTDLVFDKTGTLTTGHSTLLAVEVLGRLSAERCEAVATALERHSEHPIARAFAALPSTLTAEELRTVPGQGIEGTVEGRRYRIGSARFAAELSGAPVPLADDGVYLGDECGLLAHFKIGDTLRPGATSVVRRLTASGCRVHMVSGDAPGPVASVAHALGIAEYRARMSPEDKLAWIRALQREGRVVAVVGDGINDAPVLAGADVSIAMNSGSALAQSSADLVLLGDSLEPLAVMFDSARRTERVIHQNLAWALLYNALALPLAAFGFVPPWLAAIGMSASSLLVVANAARLTRVPGPDTASVQWEARLA